MSSDLLSVSITGLRVAQSALGTTGHNISNAGTDGYSRQRVTIATNPASLQQGAFIGNGANVSRIERIANEFVTRQLRTDTSLSTQMSTQLSELSQLDNLLSDEATGLSGALQTFFAAMQNGANDPTALPARQLVVSEAQNLADRFNSIDDRLTGLNAGVEQGLTVAVNQVNTLVATIARLNTRIADVMGLGTKGGPNDLLDQRDAALKSLAEMLPIQTFNQSEAQVNVMIAGSVPLVVGQNAYSLHLESGRNPGVQTDVILRDGQGERVVTGDIQGGELGALLRYRQEQLEPARNSLGRIAVVLAESINRQHQQGITPANQFGSLFFTDFNSETLARSRVLPASTNAPPSDRALSLVLNNSLETSTSPYQLEITSGRLFRITRDSDGAEVANGLIPSSMPFEVSFEGLTLVFEAGQFQTGDRFSLQPFKQGAGAIAREIANPEDIAFAAPLVTESEVGNRGSGIVSPGAIESLRDANGDLLPLFAQAGQLSPPMVVVFTSDTTYDILDNTDPAHPKPLDPPIRNQRFIPGVTNNLFSSTPGERQLSSVGDFAGLADGSQAVTQATLNPPRVNPPDAAGASRMSFAVTDFSGAAQFSFVVSLTDTLSGQADASVTVTVNGSQLTDANRVIAHLNAQLGPQGMRAFERRDAAGNSQIAITSLTPGYGNITVNGFAGPASGAANALFNWNIETATATSVGNAQGTQGLGQLGNRYPQETYSITLPPSQAGLRAPEYQVLHSQNASARELASQLGNVPGVKANASTYSELQQFDLTRDFPLQLTLNGEDLLEYRTQADGTSVYLSESVPDPQADPDAFNQYLANRINANPALSQLGIFAAAGQDPVSGAIELRVYSREGDDVHWSLTGQPGDSLLASDGTHAPVALVAAGDGSPAQALIGGVLDVQLAPGVAFRSNPPDSLIFGDTRSGDRLRDTYKGIAVSLSGVPKVGDRFTLTFNRDAASDNRNALALSGIENARLLNQGTASVTDAYGTLVETVGIDTRTAKINADAALAVLEQTQTLRDGVSGVNLDEEAANLIRYEQFFQANAQVISVARGLFDSLLQSF